MTNWTKLYHSSMLFFAKKQNLRMNASVGGDAEDDDAFGLTTS